MKSSRKREVKSVSSILADDSKALTVNLDYRIWGSQSTDDATFLYNLAADIDVPDELRYLCMRIERKRGQS